jgi:SAM-dependent methyltransferase
MGEDETRFLSIADECASLLVESGLNRQDHVVDVGSGYGRLAYGLIGRDDFQGNYHGFDILPRHVAWCVENITPSFPKYVFQHLDVANARYNPDGAMIASEVRFPYVDAQFDVAALFSIFTHMYSEGIRRYMQELRRVLRNGGTCVATFFIFNEARLPALISEDCPLPMGYELNDVCRYHNRSDILHAISYDESYVQGLWEAAGFRVVDLIWGSWVAPVPADKRATLVPYQDTFVVRAD